VKRRAWLGPLIHCWLTYLVAPIDGLGYPQVQGMGPDLRHPRRNLMALPTTSRGLTSAMSESVEVLPDKEDEALPTGQGITDSPTLLVDNFDPDRNVRRSLENSYAARRGDPVRT
jgi:hypothetical protein